MLPIAIVFKFKSNTEKFKLEYLLCFKIPCVKLNSTSSYLVSKYVPSIFYVLGTVLGTGGTAAKKLKIDTDQRITPI